MKSLMIDDTLILVASPFQALNAIMAVKEFNINDPVFFIIGNDLSSEMTRKFVCKYGYTYRRIGIAKTAIETLRHSREYNKFKRIIVGDYFSIPFFLMSLVLIARGGHIIYVDDGNSTLSLLPPVSRKRLTFKKYSKQIFYKLLTIYKKSKHISRSFFTFYDVEDKGFPLPIIKNTLSRIRQGVNKSLTNIYIIGTNTHQLQIQKTEYISQLERISKYIKVAYPEHDLFYCPHRRDLNQYDSDCKRLGIYLYNTEMSVEIDFITDKIYPKAVIGFGSTALLTLKCMFPKSNIIDLVFHHADETLVKEYRAIELEYKSKGINVVELNDLCSIIAH